MKIELRCLCGAILQQSIGIQLKLQGLTCWYCGRVWGLDAKNAVTLTNANPTKVAAPISDSDAGL